LKKNKIDGCASWMKREGLYTSRVVGSETTHMGYLKRIVFDVKCLKQYPHV